MRKFFRDKNLRDVMLFGRVLSAGIVIAGYAFLGVWLSNWLSRNGWSVLVSLGAIVLVSCFGLWQGWLFLNKGRKK